MNFRFQFYNTYEISIIDLNKLIENIELKIEEKKAEESPEIEERLYGTIFS